MIRIVLVVAGGTEPSLAVQSALPTHDFCVAADSGADLTLAMGLIPDIVVGDLDSISPAVLTKLTNGDHPGVEIEQYPMDKDATDLELALRRAADLKPERIVVLGIDGGRPDHYLANVLALSSPDLAKVTDSSGSQLEIEALFGTTRLSVVRDILTVEGNIGDLLSLLPVHGPVSGITLTGVEFPLSDATLQPGTAKGLSNVLTERSAQLSVGAGTLLAFQPEALGHQHLKMGVVKDRPGFRANDSASFSAEGSVS